MYPYALLAAIFLELGGGVLFMLNKALGAQLLVGWQGLARPGHGLKARERDNFLLQACGLACSAGLGWPGSSSSGSRL